MATDTRKDYPSKDAKKEPTLAERQDTVTAAVKAKKTVEETKTEHEAIERVAKVNQRLAKDGSAQRADVTMKEGKPQYMFGNFVPTRILSEDELQAMESIKV